MNRDGYKTRDGLLSSSVRASSRVVARMKIPKFRLTESSITGNGKTYIDEPDIVHDVGVYRSELNPSGGEFYKSLAGWNISNAGDSDANASRIVRVFSPRAFGDTSSIDIFVYETTVDGDYGAQNLSSPIHSIDGSDMRLRSRPGVYVDDNDNIYVYFQTNNGDIKCESRTGDFWQTYTLSYGIDTKNSPATIAPLGKDKIAMYYYDPINFTYRAKIVTDTSVDDMIIGFHRDDYMSGYEHQFFDAVELDNGTIFMVASTSPYGNSMYYTYLNGVVGGPGIILPIDDVDWTGTLLISSLSKIKDSNGYDRLFAVAQQRFKQSDGTYSEPITTILSSLFDEPKHWSQPKELAITKRAANGKVIAFKDNVFVITSTRIYIGYRTQAFGGSQVSEVDISDAVVSWKIDESEMNASVMRVTVDASGNPVFDDESWIEYFDEIAIYIRTHDGDTIRESLLMTGDVVTVQNTATVNSNEITVQAHGPIGRMTQKSQFTDEILSRAISEKYDMGQNSIINRGGSTWEARNGWLVTKWPNKNDESIAMNASPISSTFVASASFKYGLNSSAAGIIFFADTTMQDVKDDYSDHNYYFFSLDEDPNGGPFAGFSYKIPRLYKRTGTFINGEWNDTLEILAEGQSQAYGTNSEISFSVFYDGEKVYISRDVDDEPVIVWGIDRIIPKEYLCGIYAKTKSARVKTSAMKGEKIIEADDLSDWDDRGSVRIGQYYYDYVKDGNNLVLASGLNAYVSTGQTITPKDDIVSFNKFYVNSGDMRYSVADVFRHVAARSDVYTFVKKTATIFSLNTVYGDTQTLEGGVSIYFRLLDTDTLMLSDVKLSSPVVEFDYDNFSANSELEFRARIGVDISGLGINIQRGTNYDKIRLYYYDDTTDNFSNRVVVSQMTIPAIPDSGTMRVVVYDDFFHVYINESYVWSVNHKQIKNRTFVPGVAGKNIDIVDFRIDDGYGSMLPGIWDSMTQAKNIISKMLKGRALTYIDNNNGTVTMMAIYHRSDAGTIKLDRITQLARGKSWNKAGSVLLVQGGYDWIISIDEDMISDVGLVWENVKNHTLMSSDSMLQYARITLDENKAMTRAVSWSGAIDPVLQPTDYFEVDSIRSFVGDKFVVRKLSMSFTASKSKKDEERVPILISSGMGYKLSDSIKNPSTPR